MKVNNVLFISAFFAVVLAPLANAEQAESQPLAAALAQADELVKDKKSNLEERVSGRWAALIEKDFPRAYEYISPAYRKLFPLEEYLEQTGPNVDWISAKISEVSMDGNRADVKIHLVYRPNLPPEAGLDDIGEIGTDLDEIWLWENGNWWYVQQHHGLSG